jgi:hypothetical protein
MTFTAEVMSVIASRPVGKHAQWVERQFALFYNPNVDGETGSWEAHLGGSPLESLGECLGEFIGRGPSAEAALADLGVKTRDPI